MPSGSPDGCPTSPQPACILRRWLASASTEAGLSRPVRRSAAHGLAEQRAGDDEPLDLARALVDLGDLGVAVVALGGELLRVAVAAEDLDRLAGLAARDGAGEQLRLGALDGVRVAGLLQARGAPGQRAGGLDLRLHVGELLLDRAEPADRAAERVALLGVAARRVQRGLGDPDRLGGDPDPAAVERP